MGIHGDRLTYRGNRSSFYWWWALFLNLIKYTVLGVEYFSTGLKFAAIPINKQLYSFSYVCFTAGAAGIVFSAFYVLVSNIIAYPKVDNSIRNYLKYQLDIFSWFFFFTKWTDWYLGITDSILVPRMDRFECNAGVCDGSTRYLCRIHQRMVLQEPGQQSGKFHSLFVFKSCFLILIYIMPKNLLNKNSSTNSLEWLLWSG